MPVLTQAHLDSVVAIECVEGVDDDGNPRYGPLGSGVLVGRPVPPEDLKEEPSGSGKPYYVFLVTNWHVVEGHKEVFAKMNAGGAAQRFRLNFENEKGPLWFSYGDFDVAVTFMKVSALHEKEAEFKAVPEMFWLTLDQMKEEGIGLGDPVVACGFPMGLSGTLKKFAIVRAGAIARLDEEILDEDGYYLLDCSIFPGNSGGPVFDRPDRTSGQVPRLIGIVSGYLPYEDVAISTQTRKPRVTFEENSGLAAVVPVDAIVGACDACAAFSRTVDDPQNLGAPGSGPISDARLVPGPVEPGESDQPIPTSGGPSSIR